MSRQPPAKHLQCQICEKSPFKYTCSACGVIYCSIPCFKEHKASSCSAPNSGATNPAAAATKPDVIMAPSEDDGVESQTERTQAQPAVTEPPVLRPLTSLRWPYIPEEPSYPDPLAKEEAKPLQLLQYEAIATSRKIREIFATHPGLKDRLRAIDALQGDQRSWELEKVLGVAVGADGRIIGGGGSKEDMEALRALAEAVEEVSRGEQGVGLDWGEEG